MVQEAKQVIDVGEIGNASTGDILFDGGNKINSNMTGIYDSFGDQRLSAVAHGEGTQTIHATGYWQKVNQYDFKTPVPMGSQFDVDTSTGAASPIIATGKQGECVEFINTNGSWSVASPLVVTLAGGTFAGLQGSLTVTAPFTKVTCRCISNENGVVVWNYSLTSLFGDNQLPINGTYPVASAQSRIKIAHMSEYSGIKLLFSGANANNSKMRQSEWNLLIDQQNRKVYSTEYAVLRVGATNEEDEIINISFEIDTNNFVNAVVSTPISGMKLSVKSIVTQKIGAA